MKIFRNILLICGLCAIVGNAYAQNDEKYYYKLGRKYMITKDYETAAKHFYKCMGIAEKNKNENPNYYYYPMLMYYYGAGKLKQANKAAELITELVPPSPNVPTSEVSVKEKYFNEFFGDRTREVNRSDYLFLRHYIHFQLSEMDVVTTFDVMEYAVRYHDDKSVVPLEATFKLMQEIYQKEYEKDADPVASAAPFKLRLCTIFEKAWKEGSDQAKKVVIANCAE